MPFLNAPRLNNGCYVGLQRYFLTICARDRQKVFTDVRVVTPVVMHLLATATSHQFTVIAYCLMPDHAHALLEALADAADFREFVRIFKQRTSFDWKQETGATLWQRGYFDRVLRADEDTVSVARYILENPIRARLVGDPRDYPYVGSGTMDVRDLLDSITDRRT
jgi:putative transposase